MKSLRREITFTSKYLVDIYKCLLGHGQSFFTCFTHFFVTI